MDKGTFAKLNSYHVIFLIQNVLIGMGLLSLPHNVSSMGYNVWMAPIFIALIVQLNVFFIIWLAKSYPTSNWFEINEKVLGRWLGKGINLILIVYAIFLLSSVVERYLRVIQMFTLPNKTINSAMVALFFVMIYIAKGGIKSVARFCILGFVFTIWMLYFLQWSFQKGDVTQIYPLFQFTFNDVVKAFEDGYHSYFGYELLLVFFPYILNQKRALKDVTIGLWMTTFIYVAVCFASAIYFSKWQLTHLVYPVLNLYKAVELTFIERIEVFGITLWVFLILSTTSAYLWMAQKGLHSLFNTKSPLFLYSAAGISFFLCTNYFPQDYKNIMFIEATTYLGFGAVLLPIPVLIIHGIKKIMGVKTR
jgi:spore germination protein AB